MIGQLLLENGLITEKQINIILLRQSCGDARRFGEIAVSLSYVAEEDLQASVA